MFTIISRKFSKVFSSSDLAIVDVFNGATIIIGGFGVCGVPENLITALHKKQTKKLHVYTNLAGTDTFGPGSWIASQMVESFHTSYIGGSHELEKQYLNGEIELEFIPQGNLIEAFRAGAYGIDSFFTPTGCGTIVETGGFPIKFSKNGHKVEKYSESKEVRINAGKRFLLQKAITGDYGFIKAWKADTQGNLVYRKTARNSNCDIAGASKITIAEVEEIVPVGTFDPDDIHTPGILVSRVVLGENSLKPIASLTLNDGSHLEIPGDPVQVQKKIAIAQRAAKEIKNGMYVNVGIGMPTLIPNFIDKGIHVTLHGENGLLGIGPYPSPGHEDPDLTNAGKETVTLLPGGSVFSSSMSFGIIRGNHLDLTIIGGLQVSENGDLANWIVPDKVVRGMGGAMDLTSSGTKCIVCMEHMAKGATRVLDKCSLPLTGKGVVDILITELGLFTFEGGMTLREIAKDVSLQEIKSKTTAHFQVADDLKIMNSS